MRAVTEAVFGQKGLWFIFSTRSKVPNILTPDGAADLFSSQAGYRLVPGKDDLIREGTAGAVQAPLPRTLFSSSPPLVLCPVSGWFRPWDDRLVAPQGVGG